MLAYVRAYIHRHRLLARGDVVVVAVSGGPDSLCLLHLLIQLGRDLGLILHVAHLDHQLRGDESVADAQFVQRIGAEWGIPVTARAVNVAQLAKEQGLGLEAAGRQARHAFLADVARQVGADRIALGHNADDQVETVFLHLLRGTGLTGLQGMLPLSKLPISDRTFPQAVVIRPLLSTPRANIEAYCRENRLAPRKDSSNLQVAFLRNRLRHQVIPLLEDLSPGFARRLEQAAELLAADHALLEMLLDKAWDELGVIDSEGSLTLNRDVWRRLPLGLQRRSLRRAVGILMGSIADLTFAHVEAARRVAESGETGARVDLPAGLQLLVQYDQIVVAPAPANLPTGQRWHLFAESVIQPLPLAVPGDTSVLGTNWRVVAQVISLDPDSYGRITANRDRWCAYMDADVSGSELALRSRRPGERFCPLGMHGRHAKVKEFMIDKRVPASWRDRVPILARPDDHPTEPGRILWITGLRLDERVRVGEGSQRVLQVCLEPVEPS